MHGCLRDMEILWISAAADGSLAIHSVQFEAYGARICIPA